MRPAPTTWTYPATVLRVVDGDTLDCLLDLGMHLTYRCKVRLAGVDSPETSTPEGQQAATFATHVIPAATRVTVTSHQLDKYGRVLGSVTLPDGADLAGLLLGAGFARRL